MPQSAGMSVLAGYISGYSLGLVCVIVPRNVGDSITRRFLVACREKEYLKKANFVYEFFNCKFICPDGMKLDESSQKCSK